MFAVVQECSLVAALEHLEGSAGPDVLTNLSLFGSAISEGAFCGLSLVFIRVCEFSIHLDHLSIII